MVLGRLRGPYGVRGWVHLEAHSDAPDCLRVCAHWLVGQPAHWEPHRVADIKVHGDGLVAKLEACDTPEHAQRLRGALVAVWRDQLPALPEGQYYWDDLIGLAVHTVEGEPLGCVQRMIETGANDVMVVQGERERCIPFVLDAVIKRVDLGDGGIVVDWDPTF